MTLQTLQASYGGEHNDSDSGYGDLGYVAVGLSTNAEDGKLANQELVEDVQDQYVYLKHKAVEITSKTPNPPKNSSVDPQDLSKSADRIIHYVTEKDKTPLLDDTTQKITFEGTAYVDVVNGKNVQTLEGTDAITGQKVLIALTTPGTITWTATAGDGSTVDNNKGSFNQVTKPVITDGKVAGTWTVTDGTANNAKQDGTDLDPASKNFDPHREVTLEYTKDVNADIIYIDDTDNKVLIPTANDTDEHGKPGQDVHFAQDPQKTIADFENQGYVLVRDDFGNGQKYGDTDSHYEIHFVHGVDKNVEHKSSVRIIHYVTNDSDQVLLDPTTQEKVSFTKTTYTDRITHKTVGVKEVKDANGNTVQVSDNTATTPVWVVDGKDSFDQVTKPVITDGKLAGKWLVTEATANNAPEFKVPDPSDPNFKEVYDVTLKYVQNVNADITYWDITYGMNRKIKLGDTDPASDDKGRTGELIHFNNNEKRISDLENEGYVFVDTDYHNGDKYGKEDSHFNVYLRHAVKDITPNTPVEDVPKDPDGNPTIDPKSLHKEFTRTITFVANNNAKSPLKDSIPQKVEFDGHIYVDMVTGQTTTPETVKDANGKTTQVATTKAGNIEWNHDTQTMDEVVQKYITLNKGDKYATSDDMVGTWHWISGTADEITLTPTSDNPEDLQLVYEKNEHETGPDEDHDLPKVDVKQETKTFTRTVVYRGTKDGGKTYQDVNGSPDGKNTYKQTVTFTRNVFSTTNKDGKVTILETDPWKTQDSMGQVDSKKPSEVGYDKVDIESVSATTVDPNSDKTDLGTTVVTYTISSVTPPVEETHHVTVHYVDEEGNVIKDPVKDPADFKNGESYDENGRKDSTIEHDGKTYEFTRVKEGDNPTGTIQGKDVDVTYVYKLKETPVTPPVEETHHVTVHYVDEDGNVIKDPVKDPVDYKNGESYDENSKKDSTIEHDGKTYEFTRVKEGDVPAGTIDGKDVDVTYVYKLKETPVTPPTEETYTVTVHYVDEEGNVIKDPVKDTTDYKNGESYDENSKKDSTIEHDGKTYEFTRVKEGDVPAGTINGKDVDITYVYKLKKTPVTPVVPPVEETYHVTVHYVDEDGNVIKDPVKDSADFKNGESYDENSRKDSTIEHDGKTYEFTRVKEGDVPAGSINGKDVDVTYVYKLKKTPVTPVTPPAEETHTVTVNFVDEHGNVLQDSRKSSNHKDGTDYNESNHPTTITKDGKTYTYTRVEGDTPTGTINGKDVVITYVYKEVVTPVTPPVEETHTVTVHYVDEDGNVIKNPVKETTDFKNGESYDEISRKDSTIEHDGKTYEFTHVKKGDSPAGTIDGKDVDVTYVYKLKETPEKPETPPAPVKPSDKTTSPAKDNNVQHSNTEVSTQKSTTTPTVKTLSSTTSVVTHNSSTPSSPARQNNAKPTPSTKSTNKLPQTGKKDSSLVSVLGLTALGVASVLTLLIDRKKRN
ncbi:MucBP domain-containing protein [Lactobacillus johnsonii]